MTNYHLIFITAIVAFSLSACSSPKHLGDPQFPYPPDAKPEIGQIIHMRTGVVVKESEMLDIVSQNRIVYAGETHDNPASHRLQLTILKAMAERYPGKIALGMEMFTPDQDEALAKWVAGQSSEKEFLKEAGWYKVWKNDYDYYRDILNFAREKGIPVVGLNADKKTVRLVVRNKTDELTSEESELVSKMDLDDPYHRGMVEGIYGGHVKSEGMLEGFHRAQTLWDETMADSIVRFLKNDKYSDFRMVVIAGGNHIRYGFGIPRRVFRQLPLSYTLVGGREIEIPDQKKGRLMNVTLPKFPMLPYDFVILTRYEELDTESVKLGVMLDEKNNTVTIKEVVSGSNADRSGLLKEDIILAFDGENVKESFDVMYAIKQKSAGDIVTLKYKRDEIIDTIKIELRKSPEHHPGKSE